MEIISEEKKFELVRFGHYFLGLINDLKRRPEDAAKELNITLDEINAISEGKKQISQEIIELSSITFLKLCFFEKCKVNQTS